MEKYKTKIKNSLGGGGETGGGLRQCLSVGRRIHMKTDQQRLYDWENTEKKHEKKNTVSLSLTHIHIGIFLPQHSLFFHPISYLLPYPHPLLGSSFWHTSCIASCSNPSFHQPLHHNSHVDILIHLDCHIFLAQWKGYAELKCMWWTIA